MSIASQFEKNEDQFNKLLYKHELLSTRNSQQYQKSAMVISKRSGFNESSVNLENRNVKATPAHQRALNENTDESLYPGSFDYFDCDVLHEDAPKSGSRFKNSLLS